MERTRQRLRLLSSRGDRDGAGRHPRALRVANAAVAHYRLDAVRAHLLERAGDYERALVHYRAAAERTASIPERNYLTSKAARLTSERRRADATRDA